MQNGTQHPTYFQNTSKCAPKPSSLLHATPLQGAPRIPDQQRTPRSQLGSDHKEFLLCSNTGTLSSHEKRHTKPFWEVPPASCNFSEPSWKFWRSAQNQPSRTRRQQRGYLPFASHPSFQRKGTYHKTSCHMRWGHLQVHS